MRSLKGNVIFIGIISIIVIAGAIYLLSDRIGCWARWNDSGYGWDYSIISGCTVETKPGKFIPEQNVRE